MVGTGPESTPRAASHPLFSEAELLRLADDADPDVVAWAVARLQGDAALLRLLCGAHPEAAHQAAHALLDRVLAPDADAVRAAWPDVPEAWRRMAAAMAARAGATDIAAGWAAHVADVPAKAWIAVARELRCLAPERICPAAARLYRKVGDKGPDPDGLLSAACLEPSHLGPMVLGAVNEADEGAMLADLAQALLVDEVARGLGEQLGPHRPPDDTAWTGWCTWRAAGPPPWVLYQDGRRPLRSYPLLSEAIRGLIAALPPPPAGLSPQAAYLDQARRDCLAELGLRTLGLRSHFGARIRPTVAATKVRLRAWTLGVALYAAICHPMDWWQPLLAPGGLGQGALGLEGMADPVERALAALDPAYGDPAYWYPVIAAQVGGPAWIDRLLAAWERLADADGAGPPLRDRRLFVQGVRAAIAALAAADARLDAATTARLLDVGDKAVERLRPDISDLLDLGRWIDPEAVPVLRRAFAAAPCTPPTPGQWPDPDERLGTDRQRVVALSLWAAIPDADAATQMAAMAVECDRDPFLWPEAAQWAVETGVPAALERVRQLWRPGDRELAAWLARMDRVLALLGRPRPSLPAEIRAEGATCPPPDSHADRGGEIDGRQPLRLALQCPSCGHVHLYDVTRINVCVDPSADRSDGPAGAPEGVPAGVRWGVARTHLGQHTVDVPRDVVLAPRQVCRSCGMEGRLRPTRTTIADIIAMVQEWDRRHAEHGCPLGGHEGGGELRHVVPRAPSGAEWHDRVRNRPPLVRGGVALALPDLVDHAEGRAAAGAATAEELLFLAQEWLACGDPGAAAAFAQGGAGLGSDSAELHELLAELAEVRDDRLAAAAHWQRVLDRMEPGVGEAASAARRRLAVLKPQAGAPTPVTLGRRAESQARERVRPVGRNDPCPCGSGKKYKRCHGA